MSTVSELSSPRNWACPVTAAHNSRVATPNTHMVISAAIHSLGGQRVMSAETLQRNEKETVYF